MKYNLKIIVVLLVILGYELIAKNVTIIGPIPRFRKVNTGIGLQAKPQVDSKTNKVTADINTKKINSSGKKLKSYTPFSAKVDWIYDGDSFKVKSNKKSFIIRLYGIDAPEAKQPFGKASTKNLIKLIKNQQLYIKPILKDKYQRYIAKVYLIRKEKGKIKRTYINLEQIKSGYAWHYKRYAKNEKIFIKSENDARKAKKGLWIQENPEQPENYRIRLKNLKIMSKKR